jgi:hypothetical protein
MTMAGTCAESTQDDPIAVLRRTGERLPSELRERILTRGQGAIPALVEILVDEELGAEDGPADGWPPIHAVGLLVDLGAVEAIEPMLDVLAETDWDTIIHDRILLRLPDLRGAVLEPALARIVPEMDEALHDNLCSILADLGVRDERVYAELCKAFERDQTMGAVRFAEYGDPRAVPLLARALLEFEPDWQSPFGLLGLSDLVDAHERLGAPLAEHVRARVDEVRERWDALEARRQNIETRMKVGRNDPCPCGSGRKYKKCCLANA